MESRWRDGMLLRAQPTTPKMVAKANNPINLYTELIKAHGTVLFTGIDKKLGKIEIRKA